VRKDYQKFESANKWYSLEYPKMWEVEVVDHVPAFFDPLNGMGALQVIAVQIGKDDIPEKLKKIPFLNGKTLKDKMISFLEAQEVDYIEDKLIAYTTDDTEFLPYEYSKENRFYMSSFFQKNNILLITMYNCQGLPAKEEAEVIANILKSLKIHF